MPNNYRNQAFCNLTNPFFIASELALLSLAEDVPFCSGKLSRETSSLQEHLLGEVHHSKKQIRLMLASTVSVEDAASTMLS